ncbi:MAG: protein kinase [Deltaproteobacteria bacterium]|nr:protein kinase [Deltaproteobacteria bacterium]
MVDNFSVTRLLGQGGMGEVYLARDTKLGRKVALKLINPTLLGTKRAVERFLFEARTTAQFSHPHIVTVFASGEFQGSPYIAMEYLEGQTLKQRMREERPALREALRIGLAIAEALKEAHRHNVLHRDLKPENVLLAKDGRLRVVDFGLAKVVPDVGVPPSAQQIWGRIATNEWNMMLGSDPRTGTSSSGQVVTEPAIEPADQVTLRGQPGSGEGAIAASEGGAGEREKVIGTPAYMAPEQWCDFPSTGATDIWALGVILFEMIANRRPYPETVAQTLMDRVMAPEPVPSLATVAEAPGELVALVDRCLSKLPERRPSIVEVAEVLQRLLSKRRTRPAEVQSPFRGLLPFGEQHADLFYGRDAEIAAFLERLRDQAVLPVVGPSGAGKSSLLQAGVIPRLREQGLWVVVSMRPGNRPFDALAARLLASETPLRSSLMKLAHRTVEIRNRAGRGSDAVADGGAALEDGAVRTRPEGAAREMAAQLEASPLLLSLVLQQLAKETGARVLLFVDQIEEIYTLVDDEQTRQRFVQAICTAADDPQGPVRVAFTVRDVFLGRMAVGPEVREALSRVILVRSPPPEALLEILTKPVEAVGYAYDDPLLVQEMIEAVRGEPDSLPLLQFAAQMLWERRDRAGNRLRRATYREMGGVAGALAEHADAVLDALSPEQLRLARELLLRLVTPDGTRRVLGREPLLAGLVLPHAEIVLDRLTQARLIAIRRSSAEETADVAHELMHESLIRNWVRLARWLDESRDEFLFLRQVSQAAELWQQRGCRDDEVWQGDALREALRHLDHLTTEAPPPVVRFLGAGQQHGARLALRRRYQIAGGMIALAGAALVATIAAVALSRQKQAVEVQRAEAQLEGARRALDQHDALEARAKLRLSLEAQDSPLARMLWWRVARDPLLWRRNLGGQVYSVDHSADGQLVAAACGDKAVYLFDADTRSVVRVLRGHADQVFAVAFSPNGLQIASGSWDGEVRIWDLDSGASRALGSHGGAVYRLLYSADGSRLFSASADRTVRIWGIPSGQLLQTLTDHSGIVRDIAISADGARLVSGSYDQTARIWDTATWRTRHLLTAHRGPVLGVTISADGRWVATASRDHTVIVWDATSGEQQQILTGHGDAVWSAVFSPDGSTLATTGSDRMVLLWDTATWQRRLQLVGHDAPVLTASFSPDSATLATAGEDKSLRLWRAKGGRETGEPREALGHTGPVYGVSFSPDGKWLASGSKDANVRIWDVGTGQSVRVLTGHGDAVWGVDFSADGRLLATGGKDETVRLWDPGSGLQRQVLYGHTDAIYGVSFAPGGHTLASSSLDRTVRLWSVDSGQQKLLLARLSEPVYDVAFSADGRRIAAASKDRTARVWNVANGRELPPLVGHAAPVLGVAFASDGRRLATGSEDRTVRLWQLASGDARVVAELPGRVYWLAFHPGGTAIGAPISDGSARILNLVDGSEKVLRGHLAEVNYLRFSRDGELVATTSDDGSVRVWRTASGQPLWRAPALLANGQLYTHRGWCDLTREIQRTAALTYEPSQWRRAIVERARIASEYAPAGLLCLASHGGDLELWDMGADRLLFEKSVPGLTQCVAVPDGCVALVETQARRYDRGGGYVPLIERDASAISLQERQILVAGERTVVAFTPTGESTASYRTDVGVTAIASNGNWLVVGYRDGNVELVSLQTGQRRAGFSLEDVPARPVMRLLAVGEATLIVGYDDGLFGAWDLDTGKRLEQARLHGPVVHLQRNGNLLFAVSELGSIAVWDLGLLTMDYCDLMRQVWRQVPVVWASGAPVPRPPPTGHRCAEEEEQGHGASPQG